MDKIRYSVIGLHFGQYHVRTLANLADVRLVAVTEQYPTMPEGLEADACHFSTAAYQDGLEMLKPEKAEIGVLLTMQEPTKPMRTEVAGAGFYYSPGWNQNYPKLQILTVAELLAGQGIDMPPLRQVNSTFKKAPKAKGEGAQTMELPFE